MKLLFSHELVSSIAFYGVFGGLAVSGVSPLQKKPVKWLGNINQIIPPLSKAVVQGDAISWQNLLSFILMMEF